MIAVFLGAPGSGKSSQSALLRDREHIDWIYVGELLRRQQNPAIEAVMQSGGLVDDELVNKLIGQELDETDPARVIVLDGYPRHPKQAQWLIGYAKNAKHDLSLVIHLNISDEEAVRRLSLRGRADDTESAIRERLEAYRENIAPILDEFSQAGVSVVEINGERPIETVFNDIDKAIDEFYAG